MARGRRARTISAEAEPVAPPRPTGGRIEGGFDASGRRFALLSSRFNAFIVERLEAGAMDALLRHGVRAEDVTQVRVPGAWELPLVASRLARAGGYDGVIVLGCLIRGGTDHYDLLAAEVTKGLARATLDTGVPLAFGVLTCDTLEQAIERAGTKAGNKGFESALACIELVNVLRAVDAAAR